MNWNQCLKLDRPFSDYSVSPDGRIFNRLGREMKPHKNKDGYMMVTLCGEGYVKQCGVHRIVATAFIPNPHNKPQVNHLDTDKTNNAVDNLQWATPSENLKHAYEHGVKRSYLTHEDRMNGARIHAEKTRRSVYVEELDKIFKSVNFCARELGCSASGISRCCNGLVEQYHGFHFHFANEVGFYDI